MNTFRSTPQIAYYSEVILKGIESLQHPPMGDLTERMDASGESTRLVILVNLKRPGEFDCFGF